MPNHYEKWKPPHGFKLIYASLLTSMLLAALHQTIAATALPTMVGELNGLALMAWVITAYILASTIAMPVYGKLGDLVGRRRMMLIAQGIFVLGSLLGGFSQNMGELILFRAIQGLGGGGLIVLTQASMADLVPIRERSKYMAPIGMMFAVASVIGPLIGGFLTDFISWRWTFWINVPIGLTVFAICWKSLHLGIPDKPFTLDIAGILAMALTVGAITLVAGLGGSVYAWTSPPILALATFIGIGGATFLYIETRATDPIIPLSLFRNSTFRITTTLGMVLGIGMFAAISYMPTFFQMVHGFSAISSGYLMVPMIAGIVITVNLTGQLVARQGYYKRYPVIGTILCTLTLNLLSTLTVEDSMIRVCFYLFIMGSGIGCFIQILILAVQNSVGFGEVGTATSANAFFREIGATIGIAVVGTLFTRRLGNLLDQRLPEDINLPIADINSITPAILRMMPESMQDIFIHAYADALMPIFLYLVPVFLCGIVLAMLLPNMQLETKNPGPFQPKPDAGTAESVGS